MEGRWLKINRKKTVYLRFILDGNLDGNSDINIQGENLERMNTFKYEEDIGDSVRPKNKF